MSKTKDTTPKSNAAFMKKVQPDAILGAIVGKDPLPRTEITSRLWTYIKKHNLQDEKNRRRINADALLKPFFNGAASATMFELSRFVNAHLA